ncbi:hypothetical protein NX059_000937 [Plenodomus lindquistii]|nr:hypothetical protein NX059_000937 [Plenodomus lindquistii]
MCVGTIDTKYSTLSYVLSSSKFIDLQEVRLTGPFHFVDTPQVDHPLEDWMQDEGVPDSYIRYCFALHGHDGQSSSMGMSDMQDNFQVACFRFAEGQEAMRTLLGMNEEPASVTSGTEPSHEKIYLQQHIKHLTTELEVFKSKTTADEEEIRKTMQDEQEQLQDANDRLENELDEAKERETEWKNKYEALRRSLRGLANDNQN